MLRSTRQGDIRGIDFVDPEFDVDL